MNALPKEPKALTSAFFTLKNMCMHRNYFSNSRPNVSRLMRNLN